jgi:hypothetical protein
MIAWELENLHEIRNDLQMRHHSRQFSMFPMVCIVSKLVSLMKRSSLSPEDELEAAEPLQVL